ncbi:MAG: hypothetical protein KF894_08890 [Labilithrix sp.]|nr:hypothetical protein [Labilithrix sp.]
MSPHARKIIERFRALDSALQAKGWVPTSPWWHRTIERFYRTGRRQLVLRVGRRGGKSSTLCRLAVTEALYGEHVIPRGDTGVVAFISTRIEEAADRLKTICQMLDDLGVEYDPLPKGYGVQLRERPVAFRVFAASIAGVSGFTGIFVVADEVAKWKDAKTLANPAAEVLASVRPTLATQPNARIILSSSPLGRFDAHYDAYEAGEAAEPGKEPFQAVAGAVSWVANPTLTEEGTKLLEPDPAKWQREYAIVPSDDVSESIISKDELERVTRTGHTILEAQPGHEYWAAMDPATSGNAWTLAVGCLRWSPVTFVDPETDLPVTELRLKRSVVLAREWRGLPGKPLRPKAILQDMRTTLLPYGVDTVYSDEWSFESLYDLAADVGLTLVQEPSHQNIKRERYRNLAIYVRAQQADLPPLEQVRQDLLNVRRRITRTGESIELATTPDGRHADFAPSISLLFSRPMSAPTAVANEREANRARKRARAEAIREEAERPFWKPPVAADRGANAFWRRR